MGELADDVGNFLRAGAALQLHQAGDGVASLLQGGLRHTPFVQHKVAQARAPGGKTLWHGLYQFFEFTRCSPRGLAVVGHQREDGGEFAGLGLSAFSAYLNSKCWRVKGWAWPDSASDRRTSQACEGK